MTSESDRSVSHPHPWTHTDVWPQGLYLPAYILIGLVAGVASALLGIGSGVIIVPILTGFMRVPLRTAIGISIVTVFGVVLAGVLIEETQHDNIVWLFALAVAVGAQFGVWLGDRLGPKISDNVLRYSFVVLMIFTALKLAGIIEIGGAGLFAAEDLWSPWLVAVLALGVLAGFLSVLLGIGGGIVVVPGLLLLVEGLYFREARATSLAVIIPTALTGTIMHMRNENILWRSVVCLIIPGFLGAFLGVFLANTISNEMLRHTIFPIFLAVMVVRLALKRKK